MQRGGKYKSSPAVPSTSRPSWAAGVSVRARFAHLCTPARASSPAGARESPSQNLKRQHASLWKPTLTVPSTLTVAPSKHWPTDSARVTLTGAPFQSRTSQVHRRQALGGAVLHSTPAPPQGNYAACGSLSRVPQDRRRETPSSKLS